MSGVLRIGPVGLLIEGAGVAEGAVAAEVGGAEVGVGVFGKTIAVGVGDNVRGVEV